MNKPPNNLVNRETVLYAVVGVLTSVLNVAVFLLLLKGGLDYRISNIIALVITKLAAYICNKLIVFKSRCENFVKLILEFLRFLIARGATMLIDYFGLIFLVEVCGISEFFGKCLTTVVVVILNYIIGKKAVFLDRKG